MEDGKAWASLEKKDMSERKNILGRVISPISHTIKSPMNWRLNNMKNIQTGMDKVVGCMCVCVEGGRVS